MGQEDLGPYLQGPHRQPQHLVPPASPPNHDRGTVRLSLLESLTDPEVSRALAQQRYSGDRSPYDPAADETTTLSESQAPGDTWDLTIDGTSSPRGPLRVPESSARQTSAYPGCDEHVPPGAVVNGQVVLLTDDEITCPEDPTSAAVLADRERRARNLAVVDDDDMYGWDTRFRAAHARLQHGRRRPSQRYKRNDVDSRSQLGRSRDDSVTRAHFQIKDDKHKVAINFNPPVSGTHILLKLQTPYSGKNIDIQTVMASGFAGPR